MRKRVLPAVGFIGVAIASGFCFWQTTAVAQTLYVTNLNQLVAAAYSTDHSIFMPFDPWDWRAFSLDGEEPWWLDCSQISCDALFQNPVELNAGIPAYKVVLIQNVLTGETTIQSDGASEAVATIAAPSDYRPLTNSWNSWMWNWYQQVVDQPDSWGFSSSEVPPPTITLRLFLSDVNNYAAYTAYQSNLEAQAEAAAAASAMNLAGRFTVLDDEGDGGDDPCVLTNLLQAFTVTNIVRNADGSTKITWQSCNFFRYLVFSANAMSTNMQWVPQAYVWGSNGASVTSWTDMSTTNNDGNTITQRFYRVQRLLGMPIAAGGENSVALKQDGTLWAWGNSDGNLGDGLDNLMQQGNEDDPIETYRPYPGEVAAVTLCEGQAISNAAVVAAGGDDYTVVVDATGTVWTFGENTSAQLGNGSSITGDGTAFPVPFPISGPSGFTNVVNVAAGFLHTLALCANGTVWAWGDNQFGFEQHGTLGAGDIGMDMSLSPIQTVVPASTMFVTIAAGNAFSLAVDTNGNVWGWGDNSSGQLGAGIYIGTNSPAVIQGISNVIAVATGDNYNGLGGGGHSIALTANKQVWTWGDNEFGELGRPAGSSDPTPAVVTALTNKYVVAIAGGVGFSLAATSNGQVYAWGDNTFGQLGTNSSAVAYTNSPMLVGGISNAVWVSAPVHDDGLSLTNVVYNISGGQRSYAGGGHSLAMTLDQGTNHFWGWGDATYGQTGNVTNGGGTNLVVQSKPVGPLQFCNRCQREVQLGTNGTLHAQCTGTLYLYFNDEVGLFDDDSGSFTVSINGFTTNVVAHDSTGYGIGVAVGIVTNGGAYPYSASGTCYYNQSPLSASDPNGSSWDCSDPTIINITNAVCPAAHCYSLAGKIQ